MKTKKLFFWALMASVIAIISTAMVVGCKNEDTTPPEEELTEPLRDPLANTCWENSTTLISFGNNGKAIWNCKIFYYGVQGNNVSMDESSNIYLFTNSADYNGTIGNTLTIGNSDGFIPQLTKSENCGCSSVATTATLNGTTWIDQTSSRNSITFGTDRATVVYDGTSTTYYYAMSGQNISMDKSSSSYLFTNSDDMKCIIRGGTIYMSEFPSGSSMCTIGALFYSTTGCNPCAIATPASVTASASGTNVSVTWTAVLGASKYYIYRYVCASCSSATSSNAVLIDSATSNTSRSYSGQAGNNFFWSKQRAVAQADLEAHQTALT